MKTEPNEPVHPFSANAVSEGLTKREYFAGLAMQGLLANAPSGQLHNWDTGSELATKWADALIAQLSKD